LLLLLSHAAITTNIRKNVTAIKKEEEHTRGQHSA
jgi:hypothetical protein